MLLFIRSLWRVGLPDLASLTLYSGRSPLSLPRILPIARQVVYYAFPRTMPDSDEFRERRGLKSASSRSSIAIGSQDLLLAARLLQID
jgi:hypothetical protein